MQLPNWSLNSLSIMLLSSFLASPPLEFPTPQDTVTHDCHKYSIFYVEIITLQIWFFFFLFNPVSNCFFYLKEIIYILRWINNSVVPLVGLRIHWLYLLLRGKTPTKMWGPEHKTKLHLMNILFENKYLPTNCSSTNPIYLKKNKIWH